MGENVTKYLPDELRIAVHQIDKQGIESLEVPNELRLMELKDALQEQHHVRCHLAKNVLCSAALLCSLESKLVHLEVVAQHVEAE